MRSFPLAALAAGAAIAASSCVSFGLIAGNGIVESESRSLASFSSIVVQDVGTLRVHKGARAVTISADSNILPYVTTTVSGSKLIIGLKPLTALAGFTRLEYDVTLPDLAGVSLEGTGDCRVDPFSGASFKGTITGTGSIDAGLDYGSVEILSTGTGKASLYGSATSLKLTVTGTGPIDASALAAADAVVATSGTGSVRLRASNSLGATLTGTGSVYYWGNPSVIARVSGLGRVSKAGD